MLVSKSVYLSSTTPLNRYKLSAEINSAAERHAKARLQTN